MSKQSSNSSSHIMAVNPHSVPQTVPTNAQVTLFAMFVFVLWTWFLSFISSRFRRNSNRYIEVGDNDVTPQQHVKKVDIDVPKNDIESAPFIAKEQGEVTGTVIRNGFAGAEKKEEVGNIPKEAPRPSSLPPPVTLETFLSSAVLFGCIMIYFYLCDYVKIFPQGDRFYQRDTFLFLVFLLFLVACGYSIEPTQDKILNRDQTEEWKGWMQVMFVWYHYFAAKEWYNWIRVYIACYVWMTGFGNFSFFWIRKDFSLFRVAKMLFRLNFLVTFVALVTNNAYMLYYICAMHTYWFITVYVFMRTLSSWNTDRTKMGLKFIVYFICNAVIFDVPGVCEKVFMPFYFLLGLEDNSGSIMHEWSFRIGLDHWVCLVGMLCAYNYPHYEAFMNYLDSKSISSTEAAKKLVIRVCLAATALMVGLVWYNSFMYKEKYAYNILHPYSSALPILAFIVLRNIHPALRKYHVGLFAWLGKITLETYLSQLHVYLNSNARTLVVYLPGYPLLNLALSTIIYLGISYYLFNITNTASNFLLPRDPHKLRRALGMTAVIILASVLVAYCYLLV